MEFLDCPRSAGYKVFHITFGSGKIDRKKFHVKHLSGIFKGTML